MKNYIKEILSIDKYYKMSDQELEKEASNMIRYINV